MSFFLKNLLEMSLAGGVMIAAVTVVRALTLRRLPKRTFPVLWYAALVRLMLPLSVPCQWSVFTLWERLRVVPAAEAEPVAVSVPALVPVAPAYVPPTTAVNGPVYVSAPPAFLHQRGDGCAADLAAGRGRVRGVFRRGIPALAAGV